jgi:hypothetical protein
MDSVYRFVVGRYAPNWPVVDSSHHSVSFEIPFFLYECSISFVTVVDLRLQFCGCRSIVYSWGTKASSNFFNSCTQLRIFLLPCRLLCCFRSCYHEATTPRNVSATKGICCGSPTPLTLKNSSTAKGIRCNTLGNSGKSSLNSSTHRVA